MNDIHQHEKFYKILSSYKDYNLSHDYIEVKKDINKLAEIKELGFKVETLHDTDRIFINNQFRIYKDINSFLATHKIKCGDNIFILSNKVSFIEDKTYINFIEKDDYFLFTNSIFYLKFLQKLKDLENEIDGSFHFIDSYNRDARKITMVSIAEKSRLTITYDLKIPHFDEQTDFSTGYKDFIQCFEDNNKNLPRFLKTATINTVSVYENKEKLNLFFENLNSIVYKAKINFEVYLNELSLDKVKKDYDEVKTKYFSSLSDVLTKLTASILALPIALSTLLFSIDKLKDNPTYLIAIIFIVLFTTLFVSSLLRINFRDLIFTENLLLKDYKTLVENNFFVKYGSEKDIFDDVKSRIIERIKYLKIIIESYFWVMNGFNVLIVGLILNHFDCSKTTIYIVLILISLAISLFRNYIFEKDQKNK